MLRVAAAIAPATAAHTHRSRRANQKHATDASRNSDSVYGAYRKNAVGNSAVNSTARRRGRVAELVPGQGVQQQQRGERAGVRDEQSRAERADPRHGVHDPDRQRERGEERRAVVAVAVPGRREPQEPLRVLTLEAVIAMCQPGASGGFGNPASVGGWPGGSASIPPPITEIAVSRARAPRNAHRASRHPSRIADARVHATGTGTGVGAVALVSETGTRSSRTHPIRHQIRTIARAPSATSNHHCCGSAITPV